jgi:colanic acid/amylovoran biosynthesis glycosyltransferase
VSKAPLRVLDGILLWPPETFLARKFAALAARGVEITVASTVPRAKAGHEVEGARLLRVPSGAASRPLKVAQLLGGAAALAATRPGRLVALVRATVQRRPPARARPRPTEALSYLARFLKLARQEPDLVHFEWENAAARYLPVAEVWSCPVVVSCRGANVQLFPHVPGHMDWVGRLPAVFERAALVHCVSDAIKREAVDLGLDPVKARVIHPAVDPDVFSPEPGRRSAARPGSDEPLRLAGVGSLIWPKGWEYALHAVHLLARDGVPVRFELAGGVRVSAFGLGEGERIKETVFDLGLAEHVTTLGPLDPRGVLDLMRRSDALLHPGLCEGIPNVVLEAMSCELPVVVSDAGGTAEAVRHGREGLVVARRDSAGLAEAVRSLWEDPERRAEMGRAGRARVIEHFNLDDQAEAVLAMYREVVGR